MLINTHWHLCIYRQYTLNGTHVPANAIGHFLWFSESWLPVPLVIPFGWKVYCHFPQVTQLNMSKAEFKLRSFWIQVQSTHYPMCYLVTSVKWPLILLRKPYNFPWLDEFNVMSAINKSIWRISLFFQKFSSILTLCKTLNMKLVKMLLTFRMNDQWMDEWISEWMNE